MQIALSGLADWNHEVHVHVDGDFHQQLVTCPFDKPGWVQILEQFCHSVDAKA